jgi:hypothetical protein
LEDKSGGTLLN